MDDEQTIEPEEQKRDLRTMPIDVSKLPDLPPPTSRAWGRSSTPRRGRTLAYGLGLCMLVILVGVAYFSLRGKVLADYDKVCAGLEDRVLVTVPEEKRQRLETNLEVYRGLVATADDPYPLIGALVREGRKALSDWGVSEDEVDTLNEVMEKSFERGDGGGK